MFCGGMDGRLHLFKIDALNSEESVNDYKEEDMCLSRVYNSHNSYINRILTVFNEETNKRYAFTSAYGD